MVKEIGYSYKGDTNSNCVYVTIAEESMEYLIRRATLLLTVYAELTATRAGTFVASERNAGQFGKRGNTTVAAHQTNNRLSLLGGLINNYYTKKPDYRNDISEGQIPFITFVLNECHTEMGEPEITFINKLFD